MNDTREHMLIDRIVDGEAADREWREFETLAETDAALWRQLAQAQRDSLALLRAVGLAGAAADRVTLPATGDLPYHAQAQLSFPAARWRRLGAWTGWAVAALVVVMASLRVNQWNSLRSGPESAPTLQAGLGLGSAADLLQAYLDKGRESGAVVGEMPAKLLVETKPAESGRGYEVLFVRQLLERTVVPDLYQFRGEDEAGRPTLVRYEQPVRRPM